MSVQEDQYVTLSDLGAHQPGADQSGALFAAQQLHLVQLAYRIL